MTRPPRTLLVADDDPRDLELFLMGLERCGLESRVDTVQDGEAAVDYLYRRGRFAARKGPDPAVVVLDLKMPKLGGLEVIRQIKADPGMRGQPIVVFTSSRQERDLRACYEVGANAYVVKPMEFSRFMATVAELGAFWLGVNESCPG